MQACITPPHKTDEGSAQAAKILIVEDELLVAENLAKHLTKRGYEVLDIVDSGTAAIAVSQQCKPDLVLMDIMLQGEIDGITAAEHIGRGNQTPIVYMSAYGDDATVQRAKCTAPYGYLVKPFNAQNLRVTVEVALEKHRLDAAAQTTQSNHLKTAQQAVQTLRRYDTNTQLLNEQGLQDCFQSLLNQHLAIPKGDVGKIIPLLYLRIDAFDRLYGYGIAACHDIVRHVAQILKQAIGPHGAIARVGTCEFAILLNSVDANMQIGQMAQQLLPAIAAPIMHQGEEIFVTASIASSVYPTHSLQLNDLLTYAQGTVKRLQENGGNQYRLYSKVLDQQNLAYHLSLESHLHHALEKAELRLVYQPQIDLSHHQVVSAEALLRWQHPVYGNISPLEFIPLAESSGLIQPIGKWVISTACRQLRQWRHQGHQTLRVAVNLSGLQLKSADLRQHISQCLLENQLPAQALELEITESIMIEDTTENKRCLQGLKNIGVQIAIDDFGTGYSSLRYIQQMPIDILKVDRAFVENVHFPNSKNAEIVKAVVAMAHSLGIRVVAEGIALESERIFLRAHGVDVGQGYLFSVPLSVQAFTQWLQQ